jgi:hypothetical protein
MPKLEGPQFTKHGAGMQVAPAPVDYFEKDVPKPQVASAGAPPSPPDKPPTDGKYTNLGEEPNNDKFKKGPKGPDRSGYGDNQQHMGSNPDSKAENPKSKGDYDK